MYTRDHKPWRYARILVRVVVLQYSQESEGKMFIHGAAEELLLSRVRRRRLYLRPVLKSVVIVLVNWLSFWSRRVCLLYMINFK